MKIHTPGPWLVRFDEDQFDPTHSTLKIIDGREESLNHTHGALSLAFINVSAFAPHMDEPLANARLIASAPEMLDALKRLTGCLSEDPNDYPDSSSARQVLDSIRSAREIITKIGGAK
jgi:hypothetical protein